MYEYISTRGFDGERFDEKNGDFDASPTKSDLELDPPVSLYDE